MNSWIAGRACRVMSIALAAWIGAPSEMPRAWADQESLQRASRQSVVSRTLQAIERMLGDQSPEVKARRARRATVAQALDSRERQEVVMNGWFVEAPPGVVERPVVDQRRHITRWRMLQGYQNQSLDWTIAGNLQGEDPNILSELQWTDLQTYYLRAEGQLVLNRLVRLEGAGGYGWIVNGDNRDSDYLGDNRTLEFSRSNNNAEDGRSFDFSFGAGLETTMLPAEIFYADSLRLALLAGYSHYAQQMVMTDGRQTVPATGSFPGLNSSYDAKWTGPWTGLEAFAVRNRWHGLVRFEYHWADYYAEADWNLRSDFAHPKSYEHEADGAGVVLDLGVGYSLNDFWRLNLDAILHRWSTDGGIDRTFFSDGTSAETRLNGVNWDSYSVLVGATFSR